MRRPAPLLLLLAALLGAALLTLLGGGGLGSDPRDEAEGSGPAPAALDVRPAADGAVAVQGPGAAERAALEGNRTENAEASPAETPTGRLRLRLVDGQGRAVADAAVHTAPSLSLYGGILVADGQPLFETGEPVARSGADGRASFKTDAGEPLTLYAWGRDSWLPPVDVAALLPGEERDLGDLVLSHGRPLEILVLGPAGPLPDALVFLEAGPAASSGGIVFASSRPGLPAPPGTRTGPDGRALLPGVPAGAWTLRVLAEGYLPHQESLGLPSEDGEPRTVVLEAGGTVRGRVLDEEGRPLPEARVGLRSRRPGSGFWNREMLLAEGTPVDADGRFALPGLDPDPGSVLFASAPGYARVQLPVPAEGEIEIRLSRLLLLEGRVLDAGGRPVEGAEVLLGRRQEASPEGEPWELPAPEIEATGADGRFSLEVLEPGPAVLRVVAPAGSWEGEIELPRPEDEPLEIRLEGGPGLTVRTVDGSGQPLAGVSVELHPVRVNSLRVLGTEDAAFSPLGDLPTGPFGFEPGTRRGRTGEDGRLRFLGVQEGDWEVRAYAPGRSQAEERVTVEPGQEVVLSLPRPAALMVLVQDPSGAPVPSVGLRLRSEEEGREYRAQGDRWGRAVFTDLRPGDWILEQSEHEQGVLFLMDGQPGEEAFTPPPTTPVHLEEGEVREEAFVVAGQARLQVHVRRRGQPAAGATLRLEERRSEDEVGFAFFGSGPQAVSGADGVAVLPPVQPGPWTLFVRGGPASPETEQEVELLPGPQEISVDLPGGLLRGLVAGPEGPLAGARVLLAPDADEQGASRSAVGSVTVSLSADDGSGVPMVQTLEVLEGQVEVRTDAQGRFRFEEVPEGRWRLRVEAAGHARLDRRGLALGPFEDRDLGVLHLLPAGSLSGRVALPEDAGARGFLLLELLREPDGERQAMTGLAPDGRYRFEDLPPGEYRLSLRLGAGRRQSPPVRVLAGVDRSFDFQPEG